MFELLKALKEKHKLLDKNVQLLEGLDEVHFKALAGSFMTKNYEPNDYIIQKHEENDNTSQ